MAEQGQGPLIGQHHLAARIQYHNACAHALQDQRIELFKAVDIRCPLLGQPLADLQARSQCLHQQRGGEAQRTQRTGLHVVVGHRRCAEADVERQVDDANGRNSSDQQADAASQQHVADRHGCDQQVADAARRPAGRIKQPGKHDCVGHRQAKQLRLAAGALQQHHHQNVEHQVQPAARTEQIRIGQLQQLGFQAAGDQQNQHDANGQSIKVIQPQNPLRLRAGKRRRLSGHVPQGLPVGVPRCNTTVFPGSTRDPEAGERRSVRNAPSG
ncbi:hypothetical protein APX70_04409 [Pseudomonas syringae pv. maculicola]|uniref:Uncharacterized protein n=1 Tax=Pseudomonas syringae pv. maculicola TaxID=59511 RepID=A0A3M2Y1H4_PSEYM|nr:hypothetical protein APX70_04409 [Pseudomonas syringae pv. maculicola]